MSTDTLETFKLGDVLDFYNGKSIKPGGHGQYPVYGSSGLIGRSNEYRYCNELIIGRVGAYCGSVAICRGLFWASDNTIVAQPKDDRFDIKYVYYVLIDADLHRYAGGSAQPLLTQTGLCQVKVTIHTLESQRKIATILSAYDDLIQNNKRRIQILEGMAKTIYHEWFIKFRFHGYENTKMVTSEMGPIPEGWEVRKLGELVELTKEKFREQNHSDLPLLDLAKMLQYTLLVGEMGYPEELSTSRILFNEDDILFGSIRPYLHKVALAPCQGVTNVSVLVIRPVAEVYKSLLAVLLSSVDAVRWADQHSTGTKMPVIKWDIFQTMPVLLPDESILGRFHEIVYPMLRTIKMTCSWNRNLRRTRDLLLPRLISGELDVEELDIDTKGMGHG